MVTLRRPSPKEQTNCDADTSKTTNCLYINVSIHDKTTSNVSFSFKYQHLTETSAWAPPPIMVCHVNLHIANYFIAMSKHVLCMQLVNLVYQIQTSCPNVFSDHGCHRKIHKPRGISLIPKQFPHDMQPEFTNKSRSWTRCGSTEVNTKRQCPQCDRPPGKWGSTLWNFFVVG